MKRFKDKNKKNEGGKVNEPSISFHPKPLAIEKNVPEYIMDDILVSIEQYKNGECILVDDFMAKYKK